MWLKFMAGAVVGACLFAGAFIAGKQTAGVLDPDDWMKVEVYVQDAAYLADPLLSADRSIFQTFRGRWTAEISTEDGRHACTGTGVAVYTPKDTIPAPVPLVAWWLDLENPEDDCSPGFWPLPPGDFRVHTIWEPNGERVVISATSNVFTIGEPKDE